jgi:hypothetical protein
MDGQDEEFEISNLKSQIPKLEAGISESEI